MESNNDRLVKEHKKLIRGKISFSQFLEEALEIQKEKIKKGEL